MYAAGGERTFSTMESKALPRKSLETVKVTRSACKMNRQQTLNNFVNLNGREFPTNASISFQRDPITVIKSTEVQGRVGSEIKMKCMGSINCSEYPIAVKRHHSPWMTKDMCAKRNKPRPEDMNEKRIRLIHSLTDKYTKDFNYNYMFGKFSQLHRNIKEREQEEENQRDEDKLIKFSPVTDDTDTKNDNKNDDKEREEKEEDKDERQRKEDKSEENEGDGYDYEIINAFIHYHRKDQLRRQVIPFGPEKQVHKSNTRYSFFKEYMQKKKGVKLVTHLNEVPSLSFRAAKYLCPRRTGSSRRYLKRFNTYEHIMSKVSTRRQKRIIAMHRSVAFKSITSSRLM